MEEKFDKKIDCKMRLAKFQGHGDKLHGELFGNTQMIDEDETFLITI